MILEGKIISFLGDSITEGAGVNDRANNRFDNVLKVDRKLGAACNFGIGGTRIAHQIHASVKPRWDLCFCGRAYDLNPKSDVIVVFGGTNDYGHGDAPFGVAEDTLPNTFCGAVNFLMTFLPQQYPNAKIVFMTPSRRAGSTKGSKNTGLPLSDYVKVIEERGNFYGIPVLNLYEKLPIDPDIPEQKEKYTMDGLHLNDDGHRILAKVLGDFLETL